MRSYFEHLAIKLAEIEVSWGGLLVIDTFP
jgi:hypothetical protein